MEIVNSFGQTEIDSEEKRFLLLPLTSMQELNEIECANIAKARQWALSPRTLKTNEIFSLEFIRKLHKKMFEEVWGWAGKFRTTEKNIGVSVIQIQEKLKCLLDDSSYWMEQKIYSNEELGIRFHHHLVQIHLFSNGNGRHARLLADCFLKKTECKTYAWGGDSVLHDTSTQRKNYIEAMKKADEGQFENLISFALGDNETQKLHPCIQYARNHKHQ